MVLTARQVNRKLPPDVVRAAVAIAVGATRTDGDLGTMRAAPVPPQWQPPAAP